jgi:hypothetical protein
VVAGPDTGETRRKLDSGPLRYTKTRRLSPLPEVPRTSSPVCQSVPGEVDHLSGQE